jgi:thiamine-monophosphate kinase
VGGDITAAPCWSLAITLIGIVPDNARVVQRCTAEPGDGLWITEVPGMSGAGYDALHRMGRRQAQGAHPACTQAHIRPVPDVAAGLALAADPQVHALMDCSDGISKDAATMAARSGCGLVLQADALHRACPDSLAACAGALQRPILDYMLDAGEDYALLFAAAGAFAPPQRHWICIGRFSDTVTGVWLQQDDHTLQRVSNHGWDSLSV